MAKSCRFRDRSLSPPWRSVWHSDDSDFILFLNLAFPVTESFEATRWSIIDKARGDESTVRREALGELLRCYMPVLKAHLVRRKRLSPELAEELLQGFVVENIVDGQLIQRADPTAGRFRSWLLKWLDLYVRHQLSNNRRKDAAVRVGDPDELAADADAADVFDVQWARTTLQQALDLMRQECRQQGHKKRWVVFEQRILLPLLSGKTPTDYEELVSRLKLVSAAQAQNVMVTAKRQFQRTLEQVVGRYSDSPAAVAEELRELRRILATASPDAADQWEQSSASRAKAYLDSVTTASPERASLLLGLDSAEVWRRCLATPVGELLDSTSPDDEVDYPLAELLTVPDPPQALLVSLKRFGYMRMQHETEETPAEVGGAVYLSVIAAAIVRLNASISQTPPEVLQNCFDWLQAQDWIDDDTRTLMTEAKGSLDRGGSSDERYSRPTD